MTDTKAGKTHFSDYDTLEYIVELERKCNRFKIGHDRYETAKRMTPILWADVVSQSITTGKPFDDIIDDLRPFIFQKAIKNQGDKE